MRNVTLLILLILGVNTHTNAQNLDFKYGNVTVEDLENTTCYIDSTAEAFVINEFGKTIYLDGNYKVYKHVKIKILTTEGLGWANFIKTIHERGVYGQHLYLQKASTYNLVDGEIIETKLRKNEIIKEEVTNDNFAWKFSMPQVKPGSIIEYVFTYYDPNVENFPGWEFQKSIPVQYSKYLIYYNFIGFRPTILGFHPLSENVYSEKKGIHVWAAKDMIGLKKGQFSPNIKDYRTRIIFAITDFQGRDGFTYDYMLSFEKFAQFQWINNFKVKLGYAGFLKKEIQPFISSDTLKTIKDIRDHIANHFVYRGQKDIYSTSLKRAWEEEEGAVSEINLTLVAAYQNAGFEAYPVISSARGNGLLHPLYPTPGAFNYLTCAVVANGKTYILDATDDYSKWDELPPVACNGKGMVVKEKEMEWVNLENYGKYKKVTMVEVDLNQYEGHRITQSFKSFSARQERVKIESDGLEDYKRALAENLADFEVDNIEIENIDSVNKPLNVTMNVAFEFENNQSQIIYLEPVVIGKITENLFSASERTIPVDLGAHINNTYSLQLIIPKGYEIESLPKAVMIKLPNRAGKFVYQASNIGDKIVVSMILSIRKSVFAPNEYAILREFYNQVITKQNEKIVLRKM